MFMRVYFGNNYVLNPDLIRKKIKNPISLLVLTIFHFFLSSSFLNGQTAQFSFKPESANFCTPAIINFVPTFSEKPEYYFWNFGNSGEESEVNSPTVTYSTPGTYRVKLTVVFKNEIREVTNNLTVYGPSPFSIQSEKDYLCKPGDNTFTLKNIDTLTKAVWDFGNGNKIVNNQNVPVKYSFPNFGSYKISVEVENIRGCKSITPLTFNVEKPKAQI
jgi:PKD repeat protein